MIRAARRFISRSRPVIPIIIGICVGITLSLLCSPLLDSNCGLDSFVHVGSSRKTNAFYGMDDKGNPLNDDDFEPVLMTANNPPVKQSIERQRLVRMRYISSELGIREKLFVGVVVSRGDIDLESTTVGINKTINHYVSKLVFFTRENVNPSGVPVGLNIVPITGEKSVNRMFETWRRIYEDYGNDYDWFLLIQDDTYVFGERIMDFVGQMSIGRDVYMGLAEREEDMEVTYCRREAGYIISRNLLNQVGPFWSECMHRSWSSMPDLEIGRCVHEHANVECSDRQDGSIFHSYNFEDKVMTQKEMNNKALRKALTVYNVMDRRIIFQLHMFFNEIALNQTYKDIETNKKIIEVTSKYTPEGKESLTWPTGIHSPYIPSTRFDIFNWEYFTMTHLYGTSDTEPKIPLVGANKDDIDEVLTTAMSRLNEKYNNIFMLGHLVNGYRRFDPTRGMEYTLDLELKVTGEKKEVQKRVHLLRPLNKVEIVSMPYVTEYTQVTIIVPVVVSNREEVRLFLDSYSKICLETHDKSALMLIFIYTPSEARNMATNDIFGVTKGFVTYLERRYPGSHISWISVKTSIPSLIAVMDVVAAKFPSDTLIFLTNVKVELSTEFLNRVRMNTINAWQVFFPIPFSQYDPSIIYADTANPNRIDVSKNSGHFDNHLYEHASFYNSDYSRARQLWNEKHPGSTTDHIQSDIDLFDMFLNTKMHVFRAVEPALKQRFQERNCHPTLHEDQYQRCLESRAEGLASRSQLAMMIFQQEKDNQ